MKSFRNRYIIKLLKSLIAQIIFYPIFPLIFFLWFWWLSLTLVKEEAIFLLAFAGLIIGVLIDILFIKRIVKNSLKVKYSWLMVITIFYHILILGFFMGVPVFNVIPGIIGAIYLAQRSKSESLSSEKFFE